MYINKRSHSVPGHYLSQMEFKLGSLYCTDVMVHKLAANRAVHRICCVLVCAEGMWGGGEALAGKSWSHFFLCCLQRLVSVLNLDSVQNEGRIGIICSFVQATICVHSETPFFQDFQEIRNMLASPTIAYKAPVLKSRKTSLQKHYIFWKSILSLLA